MLLPTVELGLHCRMSVSSEVPSLDQNWNRGTDTFFPSHSGRVFWWGQWVTPKPASQLMKQGACYRDHQSQAVDLMGPLSWGHAPGVASTLLGFKAARDVTEPAPGEPLIFEKSWRRGRETWHFSLVLRPAGRPCH